MVMQNMCYIQYVNNRYANKQLVHFNLFSHLADAFIQSDLQMRVRIDP